MSGTVKIHISIQISTEDDADTGFTVEAWNALTDGQRQEITQSLWDNVAAIDSGGMYVLTDGAEGI